MRSSDHEQLRAPVEGARHASKITWGESRTVCSYPSICAGSSRVQRTATAGACAPTPDTVVFRHNRQRQKAATLTVFAPDLRAQYRHVFVEAPKIDETFQDLRLSTATGEQSYAAAL